jgi:hypothetical protein
VENRFERNLEAVFLRPNWPQAVILSVAEISGSFIEPLVDSSLKLRTANKSKPRYEDEAAFVTCGAHCFNSNMKHLAFLSIALMLFSCSSAPAPTYNPFDSLFDIDIAELQENGCDTIPVSCGYYNLTIEKKNHSVYYQVYLGEEEILAKGLWFFLDTIIQLLEWPTLETEDSIEYKVYNTALDTVRIDNILAEYNLKRLPRVDGQGMNLWRYGGHDEIFDLSIVENIDSETLVVFRWMGFYQSAPKIQ